MKKLKIKQGSCSEFRLSVSLCEDGDKLAVIFLKEGKRVSFDDLNKSEQEWVLDVLFICFNSFSQKVSEYW